MTKIIEIFFDQKSFSTWTFLDPQFFWIKKIYFESKILLDCLYFWTRKFSWIKNLLTQIFLAFNFWHSNFYFFGQNFWTQFFLLIEIGFGRKWTQQFVWTQGIVLPHIFFSCDSSSRNSPVRQLVGGSVGLCIT